LQSEQPVIDHEHQKRKALERSRKSETALRKNETPKEFRETAE